MNALGGSALDTLVELLDGQERLIENNDDIDPGVNRNSFLQVTLPSDGQYIVRATHFVPEDGSAPTVGEFELVLENVSPEAVGVSPLVTPIRPGETVQGSITDEQYLIFYAFEGSTGDLVTVEVQQTSGDLDAVLYLYGYSSAGDPIEITRNDDSPRGNTFDPMIVDQPLPRSGTYLVAVGRYPDAEDPTAGDFSLFLRMREPGSE
jgi:hypothetical protein